MLDSGGLAAEVDVVGGMGEEDVGVEGGTGVDGTGVDGMGVDVGVETEDDVEGGLSVESESAEVDGDDDNPYTEEGFIFDLAIASRLRG